MDGRGDMVVVVRWRCCCCQDSVCGGVCRDTFAVLIHSVDLVLLSLLGGDTFGFFG